MAASLDLSYLNTAEQAARAGAEVALKLYQTSLTVELKADQSPVTAADRQAEAAIIETIRHRFPDHSFYGEETGHSRSGSDFLWIIDPIDGTKNYLAGIPLWGVLVALRYKTEVIAGASYVPCLNDMLTAERGCGAWLNGKRAKVSTESALSHAMISHGSYRSFFENGYGSGLVHLLETCARTRCFGDLWPYHLLASGRLEIVAEAAVKVVDAAPFAVIIPEAGGLVSDFHGAPLNLNSTTFLATNGLVHDQVLSDLA